MRQFAERTGWTLMGAAFVLTLGAALQHGLGHDVGDAVLAGYLLVLAAMLLIGWGQGWEA